ncbi:MAG TPA: AAC(3) family N-acetyltransferase [Gemmatimonadaceae bacterium]|nr:AAC(3) family N-acetyltransferase [Gemmatimonadaceae bacterium]
MSIGTQAARLVAAMGGGPLFVHSDPFRAARLVPLIRDRTAYLDSHISVLRETAAERVLWLPAFNYEFPKSHLFDVARTVSELGPLPERFRTAGAEWRTPIPMFSITGTGPAPLPSWGPDTDPFGDDSVFAELVRSDGVVLYYGDTFHYNTIVHFAERAAGGPVYRYDKFFPGNVIMADGAVISGSLNYHVRPLGAGLDYDWPRLLHAALESGACRRLEGHPEVLAASARGLCELWVSEMRRDPFVLLDDKTREWAEPAVEKLGRRFDIRDFEAPEASWALS